jgi:hypothetical protein
MVITDISIHVHSACEYPKLKRYGVVMKKKAKKKVAKKAKRKVATKRKVMRRKVAKKTMRKSRPKASLRLMARKGSSKRMSTIRL